MLKILSVIFILICSLHASTVSIDNEEIGIINILPYSKVLIDKTKKLNINNIKEQSKEFQIINSNTLSFGYSPKFNVWIKFIIKNNTKERIKKIIENNNPLATNLTFYNVDKKISMTDGLYQINMLRKTVNPYFEIELEPFEQNTYYLKASSHITTLVIDLKLYDEKEYLKKEFTHQSILFVFFGSMIILVLYNLSIFLFTRDISYFFYIVYVLSMLFHQLLYTGIAFVHILDPSLIQTIVSYSALMTSIPIISLAFFVKYFIKTKNCAKTNYILNIVLVFILIFNILAISYYDFGQYRNIPSILLLFYLTYIIIYAMFKKNRQSYFIFAGWIIIVLAATLMFLHSLGIFNIFKYFPYCIEFAFLSEALLFSIALADKINQLQKEKNLINSQLISQQETEKERLSKEIKEKTKELEKAVIKQETLLKELNHRVKNNMQTIISLIQIHIEELSSDKASIDALTTLKDRIAAMGYLHELLYKQDNLTNINFEDYLNKLVYGLLKSYRDDVEVNLDINTTLEVEMAISCGLILNELLTNSFKYAFHNIKNPQISINLYQNKDRFYFNISDNGIGYIPNNDHNSFGLILVKTMVEDHLGGYIKTIVSDGVKNKINWGNHH